MNKNLVNWSTPEDYQDTGEGGLFAYATWSLTDTKHECIIDSFPGMVFGDVRVNSVGPDAGLFEKQSRDYTIVSNSGKPWEAVELATALNVVPAMVTVFLGSTNASLFNDSWGEYFHVTEDSLTVEGLALVKALEAVYGPATYTTYLDT